MEALLINLLIHSFIFFTFHSWCLSPEGVNTYTNRSLTTRTYARARALGAHKRYELHEGLENTGGPATSRRWHPDLAHLGWGAGGGSRDLAPSQIQHLPPPLPTPHPTSAATTTLLSHVCEPRGTRRRAAHLLRLGCHVSALVPRHPSSSASPPLRWHLRRLHSPYHSSSALTPLGFQRWHRDSVSRPFPLALSMQVP